MDASSSGLSKFKIKKADSSQKIKLLTVIFDTPNEKVNKLDLEVFEEIKTVIGIVKEEINKNACDAVVVFSGKENQFIAGADINLFQGFKTSDDAMALSAQGQGLLNELEDLKVPVVAAIDGPALGGGLETALACSAIVMSTNPAAKVGLPEVLLGILPGLGGCVRLPRKVGIATAFDLILSGKTLDGARAERAGLADGLVPKENFQANVIQWIEKNYSKLKSQARIARKPKLGGMGGVVGSILESTPFGQKIIFSKARQTVMSKTKGKYPAPLEIIQVIKSNGVGYRSSLSSMKRLKCLKREAEGFGRLALTPESQNLVKLFFMTEEVKKSNGLSESSSAKAEKIASASVLGAGVMGGGIAQLFADKGISVRMKDVNVKGLETGIQSASGLFQKKLKQRRITKREYQQKLNLIAPVLSYDGFSGLGLVVEAVVENLDIKKSVLKELETKVSERCVIASNTSSLSISEMQTVMSKPERFVGMHFFNPVHMMPLVEVIRGKQTNDEAVTTVFQLCKKLGKTPVVVGDCAGFLVNRLLIPYLNEAVWLLSEGVPIDEMDKALLDFGMPMGPMELIDEIGIDVGAKVLPILYQAYGERMKPTTLLDQVAKNKEYLGRKSAKGFYVYESLRSRKKSLDPKIYSILGVTPKPGKMKPEQIVDRLILPMINEASRCLEERIVDTPENVDLGMIMGTGFPLFRGGLLRYADSLGPEEIVKRLNHIQTQVDGIRYEPAPVMMKRKDENRSFY